MDDVHFTNPAGRLFTFLQATVDPEHNANLKLRRLWERYFGVAPDETSAYVTGMVGVIQLTDEIEDLVRRLDQPVVPASQLTRPLPTVRANLASVILGDQTVNWARSAFDRGVISDLETCSHILARAFPLGAPDEDQRLAIRELVEEIIDLAMEDGNLDDRSREAILRHAHRLLRSLDLYKVRGSQALLDELDRFTTETRRLKEPGPMLRQKLKDLTGLIVTAVALFTGPADVGNAIEAYGEMFDQPAMIEAPAPSTPKRGV